MTLFVAGKLFNKAGEGSGGGGSDPHNLGYYADLTALQTAHPTGTDGDYAILGSTDTIWVWDSGTSAWVDSDQKGQVTSVNNQTGDVTVQETLVSGTNIKTVNGNSLLGSGGITIGTTPATTPTLVAADWSTNTQTITVLGVTSSNVVFVSPAPASVSDYTNAGIICTAQGTDSLSFSCVTTPTNDITLNVVIF